MTSAEEKLSLLIWDLVRGTAQGEYDRIVLIYAFFFVKINNCVGRPNLFTVTLHYFTSTLFLTYFHFHSLNLFSF